MTPIAAMNNGASIVGISGEAPQQQQEKSDISFPEHSMPGMDGQSFMLGDIELPSELT